MRALGHDGGMATKWTRLGQKLRAARTAAGIEQQQIAAGIGVKRGAVWNVEQGKIVKITPTVRKYAHLVGWTDDSPERVLAGGEPVLRGDSRQSEPIDEAKGRALAHDLAVDVQESLRRGPLLKSQVVQVDTPSGKVLATIVLRGQDGMSPEDLLASLRAVTVRVAVEGDQDSPKE